VRAGRVAVTAWNHVEAADGRSAVRTCYNRAMDAPALPHLSDEVLDADAHDAHVLAGGSAGPTW